ncbi:MAG TPA: sugar transferase [Bryobacteraceae bacterium]|nr:sugar transferase [Bryobacteraceae bacterium]
MARRIKRFIDIVLASGILVTLSPVLVLVALLILVLEGRPIFYVSQRCVTPGRTIPVFKFRTMVRDAKSPKYRLKERFMHDGYLDIPRTCEVYTPIGRILERLQIVEVPQMLNILFHGMSLIGNRPLPRENVELLKQYPKWSRRFDSPAGITGIAQVVGKMWIAPEHRLELEAAYSHAYRNGNILKCDLLILAHTVRFILTSRGLPPLKAYALLGVPAPSLEQVRQSAAASSR